MLSVLSLRGPPHPAVKPLRPPLGAARRWRNESRELAPMRPLVRAPPRASPRRPTIHIQHDSICSPGARLVARLAAHVARRHCGGRRSASSLELAALGPATMVGDSLSYLFSFLSVATIISSPGLAARTPAATMPCARSSRRRCGSRCSAALPRAPRSCFGRTVLARYGWPQRRVRGAGLRVRSRARARRAGGAVPRCRSPLASRRATA